MISVTLTLGDLIKQHRTKFNMTLAELASTTGVSKGTISKIENSEVRKPEYRTVQAIVSALEIPYDDVNDDCLEGISFIWGKRTYQK